MKNVPVSKVVASPEAPEMPLPPQVREALGELVGAAREGLLALSVGVGLGVKRWRDGDMRTRWTAAGMLVAEQQFRKIIGYRDLAKLVIAIERHTLTAPPQNPERQEARQPVTV